ncbi:MAG: Thymidylate synthase [Lachnoclostridium sp.]
MIFARFQDAYLYYLNKTYYDPQFEVNPRGNRSKEILGVSFALNNPVDRICYLPSRKINIVFNFAEALWYLTGDNSLDYISYYAKNMKKYSMDNKTLTGTAYGPKIFAYGLNHINQWNRIINLFHEDRDTKRAFISIFDANEELALSNIDVSCTIGLHFLIRNNSLYASAYMRANDAYRGVVSDTFSFTFIHEFLATQLSLEIGTYYHNASTYQVYEPDYLQVEKLLNSARETYPDFSFPSMPKKNNWNDINIVVAYERLLRKNTRPIPVEKINNLDIDTYWKQVILLFAVYNSIQYQGKINPVYYNELIPLYQYLIRNRWYDKLKGEV